MGGGEAGPVCPADSPGQSSRGEEFWLVVFQCPTAVT